MKKLRMTKSVKATIAANDSFGWHIFYGDTYNGFEKLSAAQCIQIAEWRGWTLIGVTGNGLSFAK